MPSYKAKRKLNVDGNLCDYGCDEYAKFRFANGKWCCSDNTSLCKGLRKKHSERMKGSNNPFYGKKHTKDSKDRITKTKKGIDLPKAKLCGCNCGEYAEIGRNFIYGHHALYRKNKCTEKINNTKSKLCACGCKEKTTWNISKQDFNDYIVGHSNRGYDYLERPKKGFCILCSKEFDAHKRKKYCSIECMHKDPIKKEQSAKIGRNALKDPEVRKKHQENIIKTVNKSEVKAKHIAAKRKTSSDPEYRMKRSDLTKNLYLEGKMDKAGRGKSGYYFSNKNNKELHYRSSYELVAYKLLEQISRVKYYEIEPFGIQYEYQKINRWTIPDILITYIDGGKELVEVKPVFKLDIEKEQVKLQAMENYSKENDMKFSIWTEQELGLN